MRKILLVVPVILLCLSVLVIVSCSPGRRDHVKLRDRSAGTSLLQYCKSIEVIPLKGDLRTGSLSKMDMDISGEHYVIQDGDSVLRSFSLCGELESSYTCNKKITSFSAYNSSTVDILAGGDIYTWNPQKTAAKHVTYIPETTVTLSNIARRKDPVLVFVTHQGREERMCEYDLGQKRFFISQGDTTVDGRYPYKFFRCDGQLYTVGTYNGDIKYLGLFASTHHRWTFEGGTIEAGAFTNAQMTPVNIYLTFRWNDADYLLIYDRQTYKSRLVGRTREGLPFPLGVIRSGANYFYCPANQLDHYLNASVLDEETARLMGHLPPSCRGVVIKYLLVR